jgi:hypothetical protein
MKRSSRLSAAALTIAASLAMGADQSALAQHSGRQQTAAAQTIPQLAGGRTSSALTSAFAVYRRVRFRFVEPGGKPVDPKRITSVTLRSGTGTTRRVTGRDPVWLLAERTVPLEGGLSRKSVEWSVQSVMVDGSNVVNRGQQRFVPEKQRKVSISVLFFQATFSVRDTLFGFPLGSAIRLRFPDGHVRRYSLANGASLQLRGLARGQYEVRVDAPGFSFTQPVSLSRDQRVALRVTSYLDVALLGGAIGAIVLGLLLVRRPRLRAAIRDRLTWAIGAITALKDRGPGAEAGPPQAQGHLNGYVSQPVNEARAVIETASGPEPPGGRDDEPGVSIRLDGARHDLNEVLRAKRQTAAEAAREALARRRSAQAGGRMRHDYRGPDGRFAKPAPTGSGEGRGSAIAADGREELTKSARGGSTRRPDGGRVAPGR